MVYDASLPLQFFEYPAVKAFFNRLPPAYYLPTRSRLDGTLLDILQYIKEDTTSIPFSSGAITVDDILRQLGFLV
jgi:hypothetical protein